MTLTLSNRLAESNGHSALPETAHPTKATRKIAIVGKAPSSRDLAPYKDPSWEIWGLGDLWRHIPRHDRWFELHDTREGKKRWKPDHLAFLQQCENLYVAHPTDELPNAKLYPKDAVLSKFSTGYFNNSVSWMIALALYELNSERGQVTDIGLWGVDMARSDPMTGQGEYEHQRPSCEFFVGIAAGMGVRVHVPAESDLLKTPRLYGFDTHTGEAYAKLLAREKELRERLAQAEQREAQAHQEKLILNGALQELAWSKQYIR